MRDLQTGEGIKYAFEQLGHTVWPIDAKLEPEKSYEAGKIFKPNLVFCSRTPELAEQVEKLKTLKPRPIVCGWNVDSRPQFYFWKYLFPLVEACDYWFVVDYNFLGQWRKEVNKETYWLPQGVQNEVYNKPKEITQADIDKYACDVSFIGGLGRVFDDRDDYIFPLAKMGVKFRHWGGGKPHVWNEEHCKAAALSKINIGCSGCPETGRYTSVRAYKILGSGGFLLERKSLDIDKLLPDGVCAYYEQNPNDLVKQIHYWLEHEDERKAITERGYSWVHDQATYTHRIRTALEIMGLNA